MLNIVIFIFIFIVIIIFIIIVIIDVIIKFIVNITILVAILHEESDSLTFESRNLSLSWRSARTKALECFNWPEVAALSAKENGWETQRLLRDDPLGQLTGVTMQDASTRHRRTNKHCGKARNEPDMFFFDAFGVVKRLWIYMYYMSMALSCFITVASKPQVWARHCDSCSSCNCECCAAGARL